jgi:hypothetical protein
MAHGRARGERKEWQRRRWIDPWRASGLSVRDFCGVQCLWWHRLLFSPSPCGGGLSFSPPPVGCASGESATLGTVGRAGPKARRQGLQQRRPLLPTSGGAKLRLRLGAERLQFLVVLRR